MSQSARDWEAGVRELHGEAGGAYKMILLAPQDAPLLLYGVITKDTRALAYSRVLEIFMGTMTGTRRAAPLCLTCQRARALTRPEHAAFIGLLHAYRDDAVQCVVFGICRRCAAQHGDREAIETAAIRVLRAKMFPDLRVLSAPLGSAGRA